MSAEKKMRRVILADDEVIVLDSLEHIIQKFFPGRWECLRAQNGRALIELADRERPDLILVDIRMPGIDGLTAIQEIRRKQPELLFVVLSAYDSFDYAQEAISLQTFAYLTKPFAADEIVELFQKIGQELDQREIARNSRLLDQERAARYRPVLTSEFIYAQLLENAEHQENQCMLELLGCDARQGRMVIFTWQARNTEQPLHEPEAWASMQEQVKQHYASIERELKLAWPEILVGPMMARSIVSFLPVTEEKESLAQRGAQIELARSIVHRERKGCEGLRFRMAFGPINPIDELHDSYKKASEALRFSQTVVIHSDDIPMGCTYAPDYPIELENDLFYQVEEGLTEEARETAAKYFDWMLQAYPDSYDSIRLKALEFILFAEQKAYLSGGLTYEFDSRSRYLEELYSHNSPTALRSWFLEKIQSATEAVRTKRSEKLSDLIASACYFIDEHFREDIKLDDVCEEINLSPYYFSKLFKEQVGVNFIDYLTQKRIEWAQRLLRETDLPIKTISSEVSYQDPNYFSRLFKKWVKVSPSEYREGVTHEEA